MSGVGEVLTVFAAAASIAQLLDYTLKTSKALRAFFNNIQDAPDEMRRVQEKLLPFQYGVEFLTRYLTEVNDDALFPPGLRILLWPVLGTVEEVITRLENECIKGGRRNLKRKRDRIKFVIADRNTLHKCLLQLKDAETTLIFVLSILNNHNASVTCASVRDICGQIEPVIAFTNSIDQTIHVGIPERRSNLSVSKARADRSRTSPKSYYPDEAAWLKRLGLFYSVSILPILENVRTLHICFGFKLLTWIPLWLAGKSIIFHCNISYSIRLRNQVPISSPFLVACRRGDAPMIAQYLREDPEILSCRSTCSGKTPLLLAIESAHLGVVKLLLEAGADPNEGDDDLILPIFAAVGYKGKNKIVNSRSSLVQFPPLTDIWLDMLYLLTKHGASVHEVVSDRTITTLNLSREAYKPETIKRYFQLLQDERYVDFDLVNEQGLSALLTAIRSNGMACQAIDVLASSGVNVSRINSDGRTALHIAAEMATDAEPLRHLFERYNINEVNRQDQWGWTPLHYAVVSQSRMPDRDNGKIGFLLEKGASPLIMGGRALTERSHSSHLVSEGVTPVGWAALVGPDMKHHLLERTRAAGWVLDEDEDDEGAFYDAQEAFI